MKRLFLIIVLLLLSSNNCEHFDDQYRDNYILQMSFPTNKERDSYIILKNIMQEMEIKDIPPLTDWLSFYVSRYSGSVSQRIYILKTDTAIYDIIHNAVYVKDKDSTYFEIKVRKIPIKKP